MHMLRWTKAQNWQIKQNLVAVSIERDFKWFSLHHVNRMKKNMQEVYRRWTIIVIRRFEYILPIDVSSLKRGTEMIAL